MKHGGDLTDAIARHGGVPENWLDLSTGINPWPWPIPVGLPDDVWQRLPSRADEDALIAAARKAYGVPDGAGIAAAAGTQMLIQWLPYLAAAGQVAVVGPTYSEHAAAWTKAGRKVIGVTDLGEVPESAVHIVVVNPNNPDGRITGSALLTGAAARLKHRGGWLVIDEAFADADPTISAMAMCAGLPVVILRSFGKFYGLAGLRLGFAIGAPDVISGIAAALGPWPCSGPALHIGTAALRDRPWADRMRSVLAEEAGKLDEVLVNAGFTIVGGTSLFRLARHPDAFELHAALARQHIWCRSFDWAGDLLRFGLPPGDAGRDRLAVALALGH
jgi:cobalamin biosynthetic protein CobC